MASERERMLAGELYLANDPELVSSRIHARQLCREYAAVPLDDEPGRQAILKRLFGRVGANVIIEPPFHCDYGRYIEVGDGTYLNVNCVFLDCTWIRLGDRVLVGPAVQFYAATHPLDAKVRATGYENAKPIKIGSDVWLGGGSIICPGVTIGDGAVIGAGSVVTKDIPAGVLAVGNPCRVVRRTDG